MDAEVLVIAADPPTSAESYLKSNPMPFPLLLDRDHRVFDAYDVVSRMTSLGQRPGLFVVDAEGAIRFDSIGTQQWQIPDNDKVLTVLEGLRRG